MSHRITLLPVVLVVCCPALLRAQVLPNGDFEKGTEGWTWSQQEEARGKFLAVVSDGPAGGKAAEVTVTTNGPAHRLQLMHEFPNDSLTPGQGYVLRFYAKGEKPTGLRVLLMNRNKPWENLGVSRPVSIDAGWKRFSFSFRARNSEQPFGKVNFFLGEARGTVWIDGVAIEPYDPETVEPDGPELDTEKWTARFFKTGALARLVHKPSGRVLIEPGENRAAYELTFWKDGASQTVSGDRVTSVRAEPLEDGLGYRFLAEQPRATVTLVYRVDPATGMLECRGAVDNKSDAAITHFKFPILNVPEMLGDASEDDVLLYPVFDGTVIDDPKATLRSGKSTLDETYPGALSCQVMAMCDPAAGLYVASHDPDGYAKAFTVDAQFQIHLSITHLAPALPGEDVNPPYPVVLGPFAGDPNRGGTSWYDAAEIYRNWSERQPWAERKVRTRKDTPDWLRGGAIVTFYNPRQLTPPGDTSKLAAFLEDYTERFDTPMLPNNRGFERYGTWCGQEYLPVMPDEATFRASAELTKKLGGRSMIMLSGYRWTIERTTPEREPYSSRERFDREVASRAVHDQSGKPYVGTSTKPDDYRGREWSRMCRATDFAKSTIVDQSKYFVENGYSVIHFDQECSGAYSASVCWARDHGHPPGHGRWVHLGMADLYQRISDACRPLDPDFMLSMEEPNELYLPWLNLCQSRPYGITPEWPVVGPATRSVPLFMYLYHENLIGWAAFYPWKSAGRPWYSLAKGFTIGQMPGLVPPQNLHGMRAEQREQFMTLFTRCMTGYRTFAHDYLVWGRMERPLAIDVPQRSLPWTLGGKSQRELIVPAVSHEVWSLDDGRVGVVLVNPELEAHEIDVDLTPLVAEGSQLTIREVSTQGGDRKHPSPKIQVEIAPLDMVLVEVTE
ncbi:MAG TPA: DUF6259 domain-containing protein [Thermoguttaceae bacterium]|nr:DUF6259 domain-containing protein [Thermoguttaceae bacterium]